MERLAALARANQVTYRGDADIVADVETYVEQAGLQVGSDRPQLSVTVTVSRGDSLTGNVLRIQPTYGRDVTLRAADVPAVDANEPILVDGRLGYTETVDDQDYHVTIASEPVEELLPDDRPYCGPDGPMAQF